MAFIRAVFCSKNKNKTLQNCRQQPPFFYGFTGTTAVFVKFGLWRYSIALRNGFDLAGRLILDTYFSIGVGVDRALGYFSVLKM